jgi:hypothetical protein
MTGIKFEGLRINAKYLSVHFVEEVGNSRRFKTVRVPVEALIDDEILYVMYRAAAKSLRLAWEDDGEVIPLFEV